MTLKIAATADLRDSGSVHTQTFKRSIVMAVKYCQDLFDLNVDVIWVSDDASPEGGCNAAKKILTERVDAVVGHYSSSAANSALIVYKNSNIPVFLPAATIDQLTEDHLNVFRTCGTDGKLAQWIVENLHDMDKSSLVFVDSDSSLHGCNMGQLIKNEIGLRDINLSNSALEADIVIFSGRYDKSVSFVNDLRSKHYDGLVFFTDDAVSNRILTDLKRYDGIYIFGFSVERNNTLYKNIETAYQHDFNDKLGVYFNETFSAIEVICNNYIENHKSLSINKIIRKSYDTILGLTEFDDSGNLLNPSYSVWTPSKNKLKEFKSLNESAIFNLDITAIS